MLLGLSSMHNRAKHACMFKRLPSTARRLLFPHLNARVSVAILGVVLDYVSTTITSTCEFQAQRLGQVHLQTLKLITDMCSAVFHALRPHTLVKRKAA